MSRRVDHPIKNNHRDIFMSVSDSSLFLCVYTTVMGQGQGSQKVNKLSGRLVIQCHHLRITWIS